MTQRIKVLIAIIIALLFPNLRLMLCSIFSNDFPKIRNLPKIFLRSFENVGPVDDEIDDEKLHVALHRLQY